MKELRCKKCNRLIAKLEPSKGTVTTDIELKVAYTVERFESVKAKCSRCKEMNHFKL